MKKRFLLAGLLIVLLVVAMVAAACGGEEETTTTAAAPSTTAAPTATTAAPSSDTTAAPATDTTVAATKEDVLKIGAISSATGDMATAFKAMYDAVGPTQELLNEEGGLTIGDTHYSIELTFYDDQSTTAGGVTAILLGSESHGLPEDLLALADERWTIPGRGDADSLSLPQAAAILMYAWTAG